MPIRYYNVPSLFHQQLQPKKGVSFWIPSSHFEQSIAKVTSASSFANLSLQL
uniref:Uncharacterized protein n=1 Tax=Arundo donax TaxID=35708 RepID=A0A0A9ATY4_ARUDO